MDLAWLFIPFLQFIEISIASFWSGGFPTSNAVIQRNGNLGNSIFVHFEMTFWTTLTGILDFANLIFQTGIFSQFKLGKKFKLDISNWRTSKIPKIPVQIDRRYEISFMQSHQNFLILPFIAWLNIDLKIQLPFIRGQFPQILLFFFNLEIVANSNSCCKFWFFA